MTTTREQASLSLPLLLVMMICLLSVDGKEEAQTQQQQQHHHQLYHDVPLFSVSDLVSKRGSVQVELSRVLSTTGLLSISVEEAGQKESTAEALQGLCECSESISELEGSDSILLGDGQTTRSTLATATVGYSPLPLPANLAQVCGPETALAMELLRDQVADTARFFTKALDDLLKLSKESATELELGLELDIDIEPLLYNSYGGTYHTVESIVQGSSNLEHFHVYHKQNKAKQEHAQEQQAQAQAQAQPSLQVHTDAGLFLAFVPAHTCHGTSSNVEDHSFYVQDPKDGLLKQAVFPTNSVAIMLGAGAEHWLQLPTTSTAAAATTTTTTNVQLKATRHSVHMDVGHKRAWYGMMHLVPESAIVEKTNKNQRTFQEMRQAMILNHHSKTSRTFSDDPINAKAQADSSRDEIAIGCGFSQTEYSNQHHHHHTQQLQSTTTKRERRRRRLQHVENAGACNNQTNFYCWMSCLDIPQAEQAQGYINEGYSLYCVDPSVLASSGNRVSQAVKPCTEVGTVGAAMNSNCMGSWQPTAPGVPATDISVPGNSSANQADEPFCYGGTSMYMDGFQWLGTTCPIYLFPSLVLSTPQALVLACLFTVVFGMAIEWVIQCRRVTVQRFVPGYQRLCVSATFYALQLTMGYAIMLIVMIYSVPLFLSVVAGIVGGHVLFSAQDALVPQCRGGAGAKPNNATANACAGASSCACEDDDALKRGDDASNLPPCCTTIDTSTAANSTGSSNAEVAGVPEGSTPCCQHTV